MISGYPTRLLGYFVGSNYSTVVGLIFMGQALSTMILIILILSLSLSLISYRLIPIIPELREVMDWVFTDTSISLINWLRVQEIWATVYKLKVQREREKVLLNNNLPVYLSIILFIYYFIFRVSQEILVISNHF